MNSPAIVAAPIGTARGDAPLKGGNILRDSIMTALRYSSRPISGGVICSSLENTLRTPSSALASVPGFVAE